MAMDNVWATRRAHTVLLRFLSKCSGRYSGGCRNKNAGQMDFGTAHTADIGRQVPAPASTSISTSTQTLLFEWHVIFCWSRGNWEVPVVE